MARQLEPFTRSPYLHQVIGPGRRWPPRSGFRTCGQALAVTRPLAPGRNWRIHYHMPLFVERYGHLASTRETTREVLRLLTGAGLLPATWRSRPTPGSGCPRT